MFAYNERKQPPKDTLQKKEFVKTPVYSNQTGIPNNMKARFENLSGFSFDDVRVHYNSDKPAQLQALAYTQGNHVYIGPGQEKHLGHELGHVVQQKQGIVKPVSYVGSVPVNTDSLLEKNADKIFEDTNKVHKTVAQLKREFGIGHSENNTVQLTGGRDEEWSQLSPETINKTYQTLANKLVEHYNAVLTKKANYMSSYTYLNYPILPENHKLMLSGSTLTMNIDPNRFVADDIDLDYYDLTYANEIETIEQDQLRVWRSLASTFAFTPLTIKTDDFDAEAIADGQNIDGAIIRPLKIKFKTEKEYYINVELKNVTSKIWHKGWKEKAKRDVGDTMKTSEEQLYMDTCLRIDDIIFTLWTQRFPNINRNTPTNQLDEFREQIQASVDKKHYMVKKDILKKDLGLKNTYQAAKNMANDKLLADTYNRWEVISDSTDISVDMLHEYLKRL